MAPWTHDPKYWKKADWTAGTFIFGLLMLYPLMNGYPLIWYDSWTYASGLCRPSMRSPILGCAMRPVVLIAGVWGYVIVQTAVTAVSFVFFSRYIFGYVQMRVLFLSIMFTCLGLFSGWLMADIWTIIGLLSLFTILTGYGSPVIAFLLVFTFATHLGNFPIFIGVAILFWLFIRNSRRSMIRLLLCVLAGIALIAITNVVMKGTPQSGPKTSFSFLASRILYDIPEIIEKKCEDDPDFRLCAFKSDMLAARGVQHSNLMWYMFKRDDISSEEFESSAKELVIYSLSRFPLKHIVALVKNTFSQLSYFPISADFYPLIEDKRAFKYLAKQFPADFLSYQKSFQANGHLGKALTRLETPLSVLYWIAMMICFGSVTFGWKNLRDDLQLQLALFALIAVILNAFFMSNLSGVLGRFHSRVIFLPMFAALVIISRLIGMLQSRYQMQIRAFQNKINCFLGE
jgi:hypothetical protein